MSVKRKDFVYLNNSATSYPKPKEVVTAISEALQSPPAMKGRGEEVGRADMVWQARRQTAAFFGCRDPRRLIFCSNATDALNLAIHGLLGEKGGHAITTTNDHNSVLRPLHTLEQSGLLDLTIVPSGRDGVIIADEITAAIKPETKLLVINHLSNVVGAIAPVEELANACRDRGVPLLVDASQSAGVLNIDVVKTGIDLMAFTGHKYLMGPTGVGGLYIREGIELIPRKQGGTGVRSEYPYQPEEMPIRFEAGTVNYIGIVGLGAAVVYIKERGLQAIRSRMFELREECEEGLRAVSSVNVWGPPAGVEKGPAVSFTINGRGAEEVREILLSRFKIVTRSGLHCAPLCHRTIGTAPEGTVRASFSCLTDSAAPAALIAAVREIVSK